MSLTSASLESSLSSSDESWDDGLCKKKKKLAEQSKQPDSSNITPSDGRGQPTESRNIGEDDEKTQKPKLKKSKSNLSTMPKALEEKGFEGKKYKATKDDDKQKNKMIRLANSNIFVTVIIKQNGKKMVDIREYRMYGGEWIPTKVGISLDKTQFESLILNAPKILKELDLLESAGKKEFLENLEKRVSILEQETKKLKEDLRTLMD